MAAVLLTGHGGPERLVWSDGVPVPRPGPGEALVRVAAAGVNNTDIATRTGWYAPEGVPGGWAGAMAFPRIQGGDLCGHVVALGAGVSAPRVGARVTCPTNLPEPTADHPTAFRTLGSEIDGAFAQFCVVPARHLFDVTASPLSDAEIAAMPCAYGTALNMLVRAGVQAGERVLVAGASGGVGLAAVQLAVHLGAQVTGLAAPAKAAAVRAAGAVAVLDRDAPLPGAAFDLVVDPVGGPGFGARLVALRPGGRVAVCGAIAGPVVEADLRRLYLPDLTIHGCTYQPPEVFARLVDLINAGAIRPPLAAVMPLRRIAEAQAEFLTKRAAGKIVLIPEPAHAPLERSPA